MGHHRRSQLPKSARWRRIVGSLADFAGRPSDAETIVKATLRNVSSIFERLAEDRGVAAALQYLAAIGYSARQADPGPELEREGLPAPSSPHPLSLAVALATYVDRNRESPEFSELAKSAAATAISVWHNSLPQEQLSLEGIDAPAFEKWQGLGTGAGFCEIADTFFANLTERYLNFFLEREASSSIREIRARDTLAAQIRNSAKEVSDHALEIAKLQTSFAAAWYNSHTKEGIPTRGQTRAFAKRAIEKIRSELLREQVDS